MTDIRDVLTELGVGVAPAGHRHGTAGWVNLDCPECSPGSGKYKLGVPLSGRAANCWTCGKLPLVGTVAAACGRTEVEVWKALRGFWAGPPGRGGERRKAAGKLVRPLNVSEMGERHRLYLVERGLDPDYCRAEWGFMGTFQISDRPWRLYLPILLNGAEVSWTTRSIGVTGTPYASAKPDQEKVHHRELLYGEDKCGSCVVVVEGPLDAVRVGGGCVATLGVGYSEAQAARIARYPSRAVCFDNEPAAQRRARRLTEDLSVFPGETHNVVLETGKDAVRASEGEVREVRKRFIA